LLKFGPMAPTVDIDEDSLGQLQDMADRSGQSIGSLLHDAIDVSHRSLVGVAKEQRGLPFKKLWSELDAEVLLRQVSASGFELEEPFRYEVPGQGGVVVHRGDATDLASVPTFLTWLVPRYGRHTLPALLHDQVVVGGMPADEREKADTTLRDAMGGMEVPLIRRWVMWAGVSLATNFLRSWRWRIAMAVWLLLYVGAGLDLLTTILRWQPFPAARSGAAVALILLSPLVLSVLWGRRYLFGLIVAYTLMVLPASVLSVLATFVLYRLLELAARAILLVMRRRGASVRISPVQVSKIEYTSRGDAPPPMPPTAPPVPR
jgi:hypothetical protein